MTEEVLTKKQPDQTSELFGHFQLYQNSRNDPESYEQKRRINCPNKSRYIESWFRILQRNWFWGGVGGEVTGWRWKEKKKEGEEEILVGEQTGAPKVAVLSILRHQLESHHSILNNSFSQWQGETIWSYLGTENFRQARIYNFRVNCVVFARDRKFAQLTRWNMQYIPCNSALLAQETLFLTQKGTFFAQRSPKSA